MTAATEDIPRVKGQKLAAKALRITDRRLRQMEDKDNPAPWWQKEFRTPAGYDVCGILLAQFNFGGGTDDDDLKKRRQLADTEKSELAREKEALHVWELERQKQEALGNILPADIYQEYLRQLNGMIRHRISEIPRRLAKQATPAQKKLIYVVEGKIKKPSDAAPLQREITKLLREIQKWLDEDPKEGSASD